MLTKTDYIKILNYYQLPIPNTMKQMKQMAENILAIKLRKCIKKITPLNPNNESKAIGICTRNVFNRKGLTRGTFKCKKGRFVRFDKTKKQQKKTTKQRKTTTKQRKTTTKQRKTKENKKTTK